MKDEGTPRVRVLRPRLYVLLAVIAAIAIVVTLRLNGWPGLRPATGSAQAMAEAADRPYDGTTKSRPQ
jgi:hypothetical protein